MLSMSVRWNPVKNKLRYQTYAWQHLRSVQFRVLEQLKEIPNNLKEDSRFSHVIL